MRPLDLVKGMLLFSGDRRNFDSEISRTPFDKAERPPRTFYFSIVQLSTFDLFATLVDSRGKVNRFEMCLL